MLYAERDAYMLDCESPGEGNFYTEHVCAMTREELHSKSSIAAELAVRDAQIEHLSELLREASIPFELPHYKIED